MRASHENGLDFLLHQLAWSLDQPLVHGDRSWATRIGRTLDRLASAFEEHVKDLDRPDGVLEQIGGTDVLPFTTEAQEAAELRRREKLIQRRIASAATEFHGALGLFPSAEEPAEENARSSDVQDTHAYVLFKALEPCVADVLEDLATCLDDEQSLLQMASVGEEEG
jgi:hypothetical protein